MQLFFSDIPDPTELASQVNNAATDATNIITTLDPGMIIYQIVFYFLKIIITVVGFVVLTKILLYLNHKASKGYLMHVSMRRKETILSMLDNLIKYIMGFVGLFSVLIAIGFDKTTLLASAGAVSIIIGLAAQELISDFINGFFTVVEGYYDVGDYIVVNDHMGVVESLGIKSTVLRTDQGEQITIPNSLIEEILNYNRGDHHLFLTISTAYEANITEITKIIEEQLLSRITENSDATQALYLGVGKLNASSVDHTLKVTCAPHQRFQVERDVYTQTKRLFDECGVEIPYTKVTLYNG